MQENIASFVKLRRHADRAEANLEMAGYDFQDPPLLSNDEIADILAKADQLKSWVSDIQTLCT